MNESKTLEEVREVIDEAIEIMMQGETFIKQILEIENKNKSGFWSLFGLAFKSDPRVLNEIMALATIMKDYDDRFPTKECALEYLIGKAKERNGK